MEVVREAAKRSWSTADEPAKGQATQNASIAPSPLFLVTEDLAAHVREQPYGNIPREEWLEQAVCQLDLVFARGRMRCGFL